MQEATGPFAIRVRDLVVGFRRHVVIDHLTLDVIRGEIADQGNPAGAIPRIRDRSETDGGGLELVDRLSSRWAVYEGSTHVWFELPIDA